MKKFLTVLAIALIAMTAVFAEVVENVHDTTGKTLNLTLDIDASTEIGFTKKALANTAKTITSNDTFENDTKGVVEGDNFINAACITTNKDRVKITIKVTPLKNGAAVISTKFKNGTNELVYTEDANTSLTGRRVINVDSTVVVGSLDGALAGSYTGTLTMTVSDVW